VKLKPRARRFLLGCLALPLFGLSVAFAQPEEPLDEFTKRLDARILRLLRRYKVPGVGVALVHGGSVAWVKGYGLADEASARPVRPDTVFQVASVSKPVAAWGVLRLVEQGKLELDAPASQYLKRWQLPASEFDSRGVTIRRLLSHSAGLSVHGYHGFEPTEALPTLEESLAGKDKVYVGPKGGPTDVRVVAEPGSEFRYSGGGYTLLQLIVEEVSGQSFADIMQREVLAPLGMEHSSYEGTPEVKRATATAYEQSGEPLPNYLYTAKAAAGLYTTPTDLARWLAAAMPGRTEEPAGRGVLKPESVAQMITPVDPTLTTWGPDSSYGLGYQVTTLRNGTRMISHGGDNRGWKAQVAALPEKAEGIVILANSDSAARLVHYDVFCMWSDWAADDTPRICRTRQEQKKTVVGMSASLGAILGLYVWWVMAGIRAGRRRITWAAARPLTFRRSLRIVLPVLFALVWYLAWHTEILPALTGGPPGIKPYDNMPREFRWLTLVVACWGGVLTTTSFLRSRQRPAEPAPAASG
jgi:CubicO group peptidase (beta-lactamase class C family)